MKGMEKIARKLWWLIVYHLQVLLHAVKRL
jgi:hypothetical protein